MAFCESSPAVSSLTVGCSLGRGAADEDSDIDAPIGVDCPRGLSGAAAVREVEAALVELFESELIDAARDGSATADLVIRRLFAQLRTASSSTSP